MITPTSPTSTDYVAGNLGLNTTYRADSVHPALLYAGDFRGNGYAQSFPFMLAAVARTPGCR